MPQALAICGLAATKAMMEDAKKSIGFFSMPNSDECKQYITNNPVDVDEIVKSVVKAINKSI